MICDFWSRSGFLWFRCTSQKIKVATFYDFGETLRPSARGGAFQGSISRSFYFQGGNFSDKVSTFLWLGWTFSFFSPPFLPKNQGTFKNLKKTLFRSRFFDRGNTLSKIIHNFLIVAFSFLLYFSTNVFYFQKLADSLLTFKKAQDRGKTFYFFAKVTFSNQTPSKNPLLHPPLKKSRKNLQK